MLLSSGTSVKTTTEISIDNGGWIDPDTPAMILGVIRAEEPTVYLLETQDDGFEPEEFFCYADNFEIIEREVA